MAEISHNPESGKGKRVNDQEISLRQTAVALHAMSVDDRHWAFNQLDADHQAVLKNLIDELDRIGFQPQYDFLRAIVSSSTNSIAVNRSSVTVADPMKIAQVLVLEPAWIAAQILISAQWKDQATILKKLPAAYRNEVSRKMMAQPKISKANQELLMRLFSERYESISLDELGVKIGHPKYSPASFFQKIRSVIGF